MRLLTGIASTSCVALLAVWAAQAQTGGAPLTADQERALKPADSFRECAKCPDMVLVPAGSFMMGSPESEAGRRDAMRSSDEGPLHQVTFAKPFAVGRFAITFDEWDACVADRGCGQDAPPIPGTSALERVVTPIAAAQKKAFEKWGRGRQPAIFVSWDDAMHYVAWLSRKTGKTYRLLSESEREYVTRAGTTTPFWWGASISPSQANYNGRLAPYGGSRRGENRKRPLPVETFQPNAWGLYQVHGNIWEWTADCYAGSYDAAPADGSARSCAPKENLRVMRGGSWLGGAANLRAASRYRNLPWYRAQDLGFRVARTL